MVTLLALRDREERHICQGKKRWLFLADNSMALERRPQKMAEEADGTGAMMTTVSVANIRFVHGDSNTG
ncbi:unnamed protein product [Toxocara canis]|uniref:Transposase n=1 Tax=Toxocara canis TaxID=6265 RepID=A0A183UBZ0_TOXCA|nr:unnamed protein product [Toxocara canis]